MGSPRRYTPVLLLFIALLSLPALLPGKVSADTDYEVLENLLRSGNYAQLEARLAPLIERTPEDAGLLFLQGQMLAGKGDERAAMTVFTRLSKQFPDAPEPLNNLAALYARTGDYTRAEQTLKAALKTHPGYAAAHDNLETLYMIKAARLYREALEPEQRKKEQQDLPSLTMVDSEQLMRASEEPGREAEAVSASSNDDLVGTVRAWAKAWSSKNIKAYLSYYAQGFRPSQGMSHREWAAVRRDRLKRPRFIRVKTRRFRVRMLGAEYASVIFLQSYESDRFADTIRKHLMFVREAGEWKILHEDIIR